MIGEFGESGLWTALVISLTKIMLPYCLRRHFSTMKWRGQQVAALSEFYCISLSFGCLIAAYILSDFSLRNVVENSHSSLALFYRICGTWSNHEGSMMLWLWILSLYGAIMAWGSTRDKSDESVYRQLVIGANVYHGILMVLFCGYILSTSNPFLVISGWVNQGHELNPLLQDPALAIHPPLLYLGYVGFAVPFCYALAASTLTHKLIGHQWLNLVRRWSLWAWGFLTLGIALGSFWAYYELGWGGYWFWDPVETASLLPWLCGAAIIHISSIHTNQPKPVLLKTCWWLSVSSFIMAILGTYLVRSGVLSTVHAFAQTGVERGDYLLAILGIAIIMVFINALKNYRYFPGMRLEFNIDQQTLIVIIAYLLFVLIIIVLLGTLYPLALEQWADVSVSVGAPYFQRTFVPVSLLLVLLMGLAGFVPKHSLTFKILIEQLHWHMTLVILAIIIPWICGVESLLACYALELSLWMIVMTLWNCRRHPKKFVAQLLSGMTLAHIGCGLMIMGMASDHLGRQEKISALKIGDAIDFAGYHIYLDKIDYQREVTYMAEIATLKIVGQDQYSRHKFLNPIVLYPEKRFYPTYQSLITKTALLPHNFSYLYVVLGGLLPDQRWTIRLYYHPQILWIWLGAAVMAIGMLRSWLDFKKGR